jgi:hypothetical protein
MSSDAFLSSVRHRQRLCARGPGHPPGRSVAFQSRQLFQLEQLQKTGSGITETCSGISTAACDPFRPTLWFGNESGLSLDAQSAPSVNVHHIRDAVR